MDTKDDILDNFLSAAISTLNAEEIYDAIMDSLTTLSRYSAFRGYCMQ